MPYVRLPGGIVAHVKMAKRRQPRCSAIGEHGHQCTRPGTLQCDYALGKGRTCDAYICRQHGTSVGPRSTTAPPTPALRPGFSQD